MTAPFASRTPDPPPGGHHGGGHRVHQAGAGRRPTSSSTAAARPSSMSAPITPCPICWRRCGSCRSARRRSSMSSSPTCTWTTPVARACCCSRCRPRKLVVASARRAAPHRSGEAHRRLQGGLWGGSLPGAVRRAGARADAARMITSEDGQQHQPARPAVAAAAHAGARPASLLPGGPGSSQSVHRRHLRSVLSRIGHRTGRLRRSHHHAFTV